MTKSDRLQRKRFYNANRKRMQRKHHNEKNRIKKKILSVKNNSNTTTESLNDSNNIASGSGSAEDVFHHELREWALKYNIRAYCMNDLLKLLRKIGVPFLPKDTRSFLQTPKSIEIEEIANGKFWYTGVTKQLTRRFQMMDKNMNVKLNVHVDGLQLFNSSSKQFWPILAQIHGLCNFLYRCIFFKRPSNFFYSFVFIILVFRHAKH